MHPIFIKIGDFVIYTYGVMMALSFMVFSFYSMRFSKYFGIRKETVFDGILLGTLIAIFSARLAWVITNIYLFLPIYKFGGVLEFLIRVLNVREGGLTIFGALLTVPLFVVWFAVRRKEDPFKLLDLYAFSAPWAIAIGRIGCFLNGCCYGKPWEGPWAVVFPNLSPHIPRHPTQLYESLGNLIVALIFYVYLRKRVSRGEEPPKFFGWFAISYGFIRFIVEFFREGSPELLNGFTVGHLASLLLILLGVIYLYTSLKTPKELTDGKLETSENL